MNDLYVRLDADAFTALVAGKSVDIPGRVGGGGEMGTVHLILADIGFGAMRKALDAAIHKADEDVEPAEPCIIPPGEPLRFRE